MFLMSFLLSCVSITAPDYLPIAFLLLHFNCSSTVRCTLQMLLKYLPKSKWNDVLIMYLVYCKFLVIRGDDIYIGII